jgi:MYXO-CTERM domain-containing protein
MTRALLARLIALALLAPLLGPSVARAGDTWTTPFNGVRRLHRTTTSPRKWNVNALVIDLDAAGVKLGVTPYAQKGKRTSTVATARRAQAAINGDFFSFRTYLSSGLTVSGGSKWPGTSDDASSGTLQWDAALSRIEITRPGEIVAVQPWMHGVISGRQRVLSAGVVPDMTSSFCTTRHPRTAAGLTADRRKLILAVVDGRQSRSVGMTCEEVGALLKGLGADVGLNLDGGGSSTMWVAGKGVVNYPSDGSERVVSNHLLVFARTATAPANTGTLKGIIYQDPDRARTISGALVRLDNGDQATSNASGLYTFAGLAPGAYTATVTAPGYQQKQVTRSVTANATVWGSMGLVRQTGPLDTDQDGVPDAADNCDAMPNPDQLDTDGDAAGDLCDGDDDGDGLFDEDENCPLVANPDQKNADGDPEGDACDADDDGDGFPDVRDNCPLAANADQADADADGQGDACEADDDGDGAPDAQDNCPVDANADQLDTDRDGRGDACDDDDDGDGVTDPLDVCRLVADADQADLDQDRTGDVCDLDLDGDAVPNETDNCPGLSNLDQADADRDGTGDRCDPTPGPAEPEPVDPDPTEPDPTQPEPSQPLETPTTVSEGGGCTTVPSPVGLLVLAGLARRRRRRAV